MTYIESFSNARYKGLKGLSRSRNRRKERRFLMEGRVELELAFRKGHRPKTVVYTSAYMDPAELKKLLQEDVETLELSKALFDSLAYQQVPGNFIAVFEAFEHTLTGSASLLAVFEGIEKPGNLGAVLRTCDALGVEEVIVADSEIDLFNPNVIRNSRGAVFSVRCVFKTNEEARAILVKSNYRVLLAALDDESVDFSSVKPSGPAALVMGSESKGLSAFWMNGDGEKVVIPMAGEVDSLNVSVSFAILASYFKSNLV